jgi:hypothetical protein
MAHEPIVDVYAPAADPGKVSPITADVKAWLTGPDKPTPHLSGTIEGRRCHLYDLAALRAKYPGRQIGHAAQPFQAFVVVWDPETPPY